MDYGTGVVRVVLYQPEIPQNVGNIARTCAAVGAELHLVRPFGFRWGDPRMKRAGLDYWPHVRYVLHDTWAAFLETLGPQDRLFAFTTKGERRYTEVAYRPGDYLLFGPETRGLPPEILEVWPRLVIPMPGPVRSLNLSVAVGVAVYEALRQAGFAAPGE
ncbi:tRNA/rRNA methyltransferase (SpoU) [Marinithermus hydrothermalis DSM 14884]|uniref:Putative tRNA (cytidine(34)-2'-O)-methyltransferase n=1 Tax=Marinithermus hydrothermalis (strain DSM 14884 / JCM 11576 / T1) TaxID=869210 RepID=F2NQA1_MARHT|nr:tRNA/rRNA methyltransferase (SpoU) [Marinithermus hydrothermalis DSM 14884]